MDQIASQLLKHCSKSSNDWTTPWYHVQIHQRDALVTGFSFKRPLSSTLQLAIRLCTSPGTAAHPFFSSATPKLNEMPKLKAPWIFQLWPPASHRCDDPQDISHLYVAPLLRSELQNTLHEISWTWKSHRLHCPCFHDVAWSDQVYVSSGPDEVIEMIEACRSCFLLGNRILNQGTKHQKRSSKAILPDKI